MKNNKTNFNKINAEPYQNFNTILRRVTRFVKAIGYVGQAATGRPKTVSDETLLALLIYCGQRGINNNIFKVYQYGQIELNLCLPHYKNVCQQVQQLLPLIEQYLAKLCRQVPSKTVIVDSTPAPICKYFRAQRQRSAAQQATFGYGTTEGKYFGFKLHLSVNQNQQLVAAQLTSANVYDGHVAPDLTTPLTTTLIGDNHYGAESLRQQLAQVGCQVIAPRRKNQLDQSQPPDFPKHYRLRSRVETVFSVLKERFNLLTFRARSFGGFKLHYFVVLLVYQTVKLYG